MKLKFVDDTSISNVSDINDYLDFSPAGYNTLLAYHSFAAPFGIAGTILVLVGSVKYNAIAVDR